MVKNWQILHILLQKKVLARFWSTWSNFHFSNLKIPKRGAQNRGRTFFWRRIYKIWQFLTIEFYLTFTEKKIRMKILHSAWCLLRPKSLTSPKFQNRPKSRFLKMMKMIEKMMKKTEKKYFSFFFIITSDTCLGAVRSVLWTSKLVFWWCFGVILRPIFQVFGEIPVQMILDCLAFPEISLSLGPPISELKRS